MVGIKAGREEGGTSSGEFKADALALYFSSCQLQTMLEPTGTTITTIVVVKTGEAPHPAHPNYKIGRRAPVS